MTAIHHPTLERAGRRLEDARWNGKHIPASHPVVKRQVESQEIASGLPGSSAAMQDATDRLEAIAIAIYRLPDRRLSLLQQRMVDTIVAELLRRRHA